MKKDHVLKDFFSYPMRFADFMNALFFDGHAIIHPCDLHPLDSREIFIGDFLSKERTHDVIMMWERKDFQAILILEAQSSVVATLTGREDILEKMKGEGVKVYEPDLAPFKEKAEPMFEEMEEVWGEGLYEKVLSYSKESE